MHEFALAQSIRDAAIELAGEHGCSKVTAVTCRIGVMRQVVPELLRTAFDIVTRETPAEGARLELEREPMEALCADCGQWVKVWALIDACPHCRSFRVHHRGGMSVSLSSVTADEEIPDEDRCASCRA